MFLKSWVQMGGFELTHYWHRVDVLIVFECALLAMVGCLGLALVGRFVKRSRRLTILSLIGAVSFATAAWAANTALSALTAAGAISGTNLFYVVQTAGVGGVKATATQIATFINSLFSGDATVTSGGAVTVLKLNGTTPPASAIFKGNGAGGIASAVSGTDYAPATSGSSILKGNAAGGFANAAAGTDYAPATSGSSLLKGNGAGGFSNAASGTDYAPATSGSLPLFGNGAGGFTNGSKSGSTTLLMTGSGTFTSGHCPQFDVNLNLVDSGAACGGGGSGVTSLTPGAALVSSTTAPCSQAALTSAGIISAAECLNAQVGTTYAIQDSDRGKLITGTNAAAQAYSIAQAGASTTFQAGWYTRVQNRGAGILVITPATSTIGGAASYTLYPGWTVKITSDGANYQVDGGTTGGVTVNPQTGTNYAFTISDFGKLVNLANAANQVPTLPAPSAVGATWYTEACNQGAGTQTLTPASGTIGGAATFVLPAGTAAAPKCAAIVSDGANYQVVPDFSTAGGTSTIASGTAALGVAAIASGACATVVTATATGVATTDVLTASFNGDPTAVTGYIPTTAGMLSVITYPTANTANFKVCNNTASSITPGAITLNWRVVR
jgi:hypothetical protein